MNIPLNSLDSKKVKTKLENDVLHVPAEVANLGKNRNHVNIPGNFKLPFRLDMTVKIEYHHLNQVASQLTLYVGNGTVYFNGGHVSATDIWTKDNIAPDFVRYNCIPEKEFADISVFFGTELMWVSVDGAFCFATEKMSHMDAVGISICGGTATRLCIRSLAVTQYEENEPGMPPELLGLPGLSEFEQFLNGLPPYVIEEMREIDEFLTARKYRRSLKHGFLTYRSANGFRMEIREFGAGKEIITAWAPTDKKPDITNIVIYKLAETSPEFAAKIFDMIRGCEVHSRGCQRTVVYEFAGSKKTSCCGRMNISLDAQGLHDLHRFVEAIQLVSR